MGISVALIVEKSTACGEDDSNQCTEMMKVSENGTKKFW